MDSDRSAQLLTAVARWHPGPGGPGLTGLCGLIAEGLDVRQVELQLGTSPAYHWPPRPTDNGGSSRDLRRIDISLAGNKIGELRVDRGGRWTGRRQTQLLSGLADVLGPVLYEVGLQREFDAALASARDHAERIAAARRQALMARDSERRDLERNLHDGAQHHLVALGMAVGLLEHQLSTGDLVAADESLHRLRSGLDRAEQTLLTTAAGVYPSQLVEHGLVEALSAEFRLSERIQIKASLRDIGRRFLLLVETAVYFTCLEAVTNARKHAPDAHITVLLTEHDGGLAFSVTDDGPGLDLERADSRASFGLGAMRDRIAAAGGKLVVRSADNVGTAVEGFIPL